MLSQGCSEGQGDLHCLPTPKGLTSSKNTSTLRVMLVASGTIPELVKTFAELVAKGEIEVYNEFSLQHELGILLRQRFPENRVQFERNVSHFSMPKKNFTKKEIDISVFSPDMTDLLCAIELKYPRNGQYPEQMYSFCKDLAFTEELRASGFRQAFVMIFADDRLFYEGAGAGIYGYFRAGKELHGADRQHLSDQHPPRLCWRRHSRFAR